MATVKKIEIPEVEALTRELINHGSKIREHQDGLEMLLIEQKGNLADFKSGNIQKVAFRDINTKFDKEKMSTINKLTQTVKTGLITISKMRTIVKAYKV
jgi:hypothetical protein